MLVQRPTFLGALFKIWYRARILPASRHPALTATSSPTRTTAKSRRRSGREGPPRVLAAHSPAPTVRSRRALRRTSPPRVLAASPAPTARSHRRPGREGPPRVLAAPYAASCLSAGPSRPGYRPSASRRTRGGRAPWPRAWAHRRMPCGRSRSDTSSRGS